jgi:hypothetical protein
MAFIKTGNIKNAIAKQGGFYSVKGEKLKAAKLTQAEIDEWNGVKSKVAAKVEVVVEDDLQPMLEAAAEDLEKTITTSKKKKK